MSLDKEVRAAHFEYVDLRYASMDAMICKHCGSMVVDTSWKVHVVNCPALNRWLTTELRYRYYDEIEPDLERVLRAGPRKPSTKPFERPY